MILYDAAPNVDKKLSKNYLVIFQKLIVCMYIVAQMYHLVPMQRELSLIFHRNNVYEHFEQVCKPSEWIERESRYMIDLSSLICHFFEKSMIAHAALLLKDAFAPQFTSTHAILDSVDFFG